MYENWTSGSITFTVPDRSGTRVLPAVTCLAISTRPSQSSIRFLAEAARLNLKWNYFPSKNVGRQISNGIGAPQASLAMIAISTP